MRLRIHFIPTLSALCAGGFLATVILCLTLVPSAQRNQSELLGHYGQALAAMAAKQAVDASFNHDLVRLQLILQDVIENPHTVLATIHDVENNLLVQAGDTRTALKNHVNFTSPIILHDSIAGYVSITLDTQPWSKNSLLTLLIALAILLLCLTLWFMFHRQAVSWDSSPPKPKTEIPPENSSIEDSEPELGEVTTLPEEARESVFAVIHIKNLHVLRQQLNGQSFRDTIGRLEKIISDVLALYGGQQFQLIDNYYILKFHTQQNRGEALFHASCSAYLILELAGIINKVPLDLAALVSANEDDVVPEKLPFAGLIVEATAGSEALINRRIEFMELGKDDGRQVLSGFRQPFKTLLENQRKQLCQIL